MKIRICTKEARDKLPNHDFTLKCIGGDAKCHLVVMVMYSKTIRDMIEAGGVCKEISFDVDINNMETVLDYVYGQATAITTEEIDQDSLSIDIARVFELLQTGSVFMNYKLYMKNIKNVDFRDRNFDIDNLLDWLAGDEKYTYPDEITRDVCYNMCERLNLTTGRHLTNTKLLKFDVRTLKYLFELMNKEYIRHDLRVSFLAEYMTPENKSDIMDILLPRTAMIHILASDKELADKFELPQSVEFLLKYQLDRGLFFDRWTIYNLVTNDGIHTMEVYIDRSGKTPYETFTLDDTYMSLYKELGPRRISRSGARAD